jgi:DNA repair protein RecO (recombination protein O)
MPEYRTLGLVLRTFEQGESDRLVHVYTERLGRVSAIAKGARRSRRRFPGTLEIFSVLRLQLVDPPRASLMRLDGASLEIGFEGLVRDLGRYAIACQLLEILDRFTAEQESNPAMFRFACGVLGVLEEERPDRLLALLVATKTLARLGYRPVLAECVVCGTPLADPDAGPGPAPGAQVAFAPRHGGAVCLRCADAEDARVPAALLLALEAGIRSPLRDRAGLGLGERAVRRAELLMDRFFRFHVGFELRSAGFLRDFVQFAPLDVAGTPGDTAPAPPSAGAERAPLEAGTEGLATE